MNLVYEQVNEHAHISYYRIVAKINTRTQTGEWAKFVGDTTNVNATPSLIYPVSIKNNTLFIDKQMFLFSRPGFCWDGEDDIGKFQSCIEAILPSFTVSDIRFDSVYVCRLRYTDSSDSSHHRYYVSAPYKIYLQHEILSSSDDIRVIEKLVHFETP